MTLPTRTLQLENGIKLQLVTIVKPRSVAWIPGMSAMADDAFKDMVQHLADGAQLCVGATRTGNNVLVHAELNLARCQDLGIGLFSALDYLAPQQSQPMLASLDRRGAPTSVPQPNLVGAAVGVTSAADHRSYLGNVFRFAATAVDYVFYALHHFFRPQST